LGNYELASIQNLYPAGSVPTLYRRSWARAVPGLVPAALLSLRFSRTLPEAFIASASPSYCLWGKYVNKKFSSEGNYFWRGFPDIYFSGGQILLQKLSAWS
jgi:hypothetical protein